MSSDDAAASSIPQTMKAVVVKEHGGVEKLLVEPAWPVPQSLADDEVLVQNAYAGLNFIDTYYRSGLYKQPLPFVAGQEGGGVVVAVGGGVSTSGDNTTVSVGDEVVYMCLGSYCEYTAVPVSKVVKLPEDDSKIIDMKTALACMVQGLTAHYLVTDATCNLIQPGKEWCLIYSVGSGTGQWAAQMAKQIQGYKVIGTTSQKKAASVPPGAVDELIVLDSAAGDGKSSYADYSSVDIVQRVMEITKGEGCKLIVDGVGKSTADISIQCLARRGIWISFGNASGAVPPFSLLKLTQKSAFVTRPKLGDYIATREELEKRTRDVFGWVADGKLKVSVDAIFPLFEDQGAAQGHEYIEAGQSKGKVLFKI